MPDPYSILEIPTTASPDEIKKAYKRLALQWHPDKNKSPEALAKFQQVSEAYEALTHGPTGAAAGGTPARPFWAPGEREMHARDVFSQFFKGRDPFGEESEDSFFRSASSTSRRSKVVDGKKITIIERIGKHENGEPYRTVTEEVFDPKTGATVSRDVTASYPPLNN